MEEHKYFISYFYGEGLGKGNAEIKTQKKIEGMEEIREIERLIEDRESKKSSNNNIQRILIKNLKKEE